MTKRAVWFASLVVALLSVASVAYRAFTPVHFDAAAWRGADEPSEFLDRRAMMRELEQQFAAGQIPTSEAATRTLGQPERTADDDANIWFYNLGGQHDAAAPESITWLELTFDDTGRLLRHRVIQELIVPK